MSPQQAAAILSWLNLAEVVHKGLREVISGGNKTPEELAALDARAQTAHDSIQGWTPGS